MIPKIIHYCWFSGEEFPPIVKKCIDSWHRYMPDYEFRLWDMEAIKDINIPYVREALECRKWAFVSDYVRLYAVEKYGGIYLDSDIEVFDTLDKLLDCRMFIGREEDLNFYNWYPARYMTSHIFGAQSHHPFIKACMKYYETRHFLITDDENLPESLRYCLEIAPKVMSLVGVKYGYWLNAYAKEKQVCKDGIIVYPPSVLGCNCSHINSDAICIHYQLGSWKNSYTNCEIGVDKVPLWRKAVEKLKIRNKLVALLRKLGYVAYKI